MKICTRCLATKDESQFSKHKYGKEGLRSWCKECCNQVSKEIRIGRNRDFSLRAKHNISEKQYLDLLEKQGGVCAACGGSDPQSRWNVFAVDHDHACCPGSKSCGLCIRGLLCYTCNIALGNVSDSISRLEQLIKYLKQQSPLPSCLLTFWRLSCLSFS